MKSFISVLLAIGVFMLITPAFTFSRKEKALQADNIDVTRMESTHIAWPYYVGGIALAAGVLLLFVDNRRKERE